MGPFRVRARTCVHTEFYELTMVTTAALRLCRNKKKLYR